MRILTLGPFVELVLLLLLTLVVAAVLCVPPLRQGDRARALRRLLASLLVGSVAAVLVVTLLRTMGPGSTNLMPLRGIVGQLGNLNRTVGVVNLVGNVLLFVPAALLARPVLGWRPARITLAGAALSVAVETAQAFAGRSADVDDVLLNTLGALTGALLGALLARLVERRRTHSAPGAPEGSGAQELART